MTKRFQIRDSQFGLAIYEADSGRDALLEFFADRAKAEHRASITDDGAGGATVTVDGETYHAVAAT